MDTEKTSGTHPSKARRDVRYVFRGLVVAIVISSVAPVFFNRNHVQPAAQLIVLLAAASFLISYGRSWRKPKSSSSQPSTQPIEFKKASDEGNDPTLEAVGPKR